MRKTLATVFAIAGSVSTAAYAADRPIKVDDRLDASADALTDMMRAFDRGIPQDLLDKARCVVVVPGMRAPMEWAHAMLLPASPIHVNGRPSV